MRARRSPTPGAAVGGAKLRYRVVRQVRYPDWWYWCFAWRMPQHRARRRSPTARPKPQADGTFKIQFIAKPDLSVPEKTSRSSSSQVSADVTDTNGETRSAERTVQAGYTALRASLTASDWLTAGKPVEITLSTTTLDGEPQKAEGSLKIYRLKQPEKVVRPDILGQRPIHQPRAFAAAAKEPRRPAKPQSAARRRPIPRIPTPGNWAKSSPSRGSTTDAAGHTTWSTKLEAGAYRAKFETQDRFGKKIVALLPLNVLAPEAKTVPHQDPEPRGRTQVDAGAGRGVHGPLGQRLRSGPGVHRDRTSRQAAAELLDRSRALPSSRSSRR